MTIYEEKRFADTKSNSSDVVLSCMQKLKTLNEVTEEDFLSIGNHLNSVASLATRIAEAALSVSRMVDSEEVREKEERLEKVFGIMEEHFRRSQQKLQGNLLDLQSVLDLIDKADPFLLSFRHIIKHLHMLGISTKIESAHMQNSNGNFSVMAEDVEKLSHVIANKTDAMGKNLASLQALVQATISGILEMQDEGLVKTKQTFSDIRTALITFSKKRSLSSEAVPFLAEQSQVISKKISAVVSSLQFHDITRQQIEHVIGTLNEVGLMVSDGGMSQDIVTAILTHACSLQAEQVKNSRQELLSALTKIVEDLKGISKDALAISTRTKGLISHDGESDFTFLAGLNRSASSALSFLAENEALDARLAVASQSVSDTTGKLAGFADEIEEIGEEIELTALNARIKAAHAAIDGAALDVIAEAITNLSDDAGHQTSAISGTLERIHSVADKMNTLCSSKTTSEENSDDLVKDVKDLCGSVQDSENTVLSILNGLEKETRQLVDSIEELMKGMTVHAKIDEVLSSVIHDLLTVAARGRREGCEGGHEKSDEYMKYLASRYTMHRERLIHQSHAGVSSHEKDNAGEYVGDNVEFF